MNYINKTLLAGAMAGLFGVAGLAQAGPPAFVGEDGGPSNGAGERQGPPFDTPPGQNRGGGPPADRGNAGGNGSDEENEEESEGEDTEQAGFCNLELDSDGPPGRAGRSHIAHLNFSQQDPETGEPVEDGAWARMRYTWVGPALDFTFNGHGLRPDAEYTLTYQPQPAPSPGVVCLGSGFANGGGNLHLGDEIELNGNLPMPDDANQDGALLALVVSEDVDCSTGEMLTYLPGDYLFGNTLVEYVDSDLLEEEPEEEESEEGEEGETDG